jgi:hypothetical protein
MRGVAASDTVLPKWCTVSVPWSNDQVGAGFSIVVSDLASKIAIVALI